MSPYAPDKVLAPVSGADGARFFSGMKILSFWKRHEIATALRASQ
jgi:hypothetical protein